ncbi:AAA family ATPase [Poriferisphaera sp. WC338]|uniref:AAA family ATPase n=1 Tax=Poriferisphaera sp. WC338 TaxID=3425129 RepID=UPI003D81A406
MNENTQVLEQAKQFVSTYKAVKDQVGRVIVGHDDIIDGVLTCLFVGGHCLLEGVPGLGKTLLIRSLSEALSLDFSRIQFTPDLMPADITGTTIVVEGQSQDGSIRREFQFQRGPIFSQIILADEINRATPKTQSSMLEAMQERSVTVSGTSHPMAKPFFVMATQNPLEQEGTYPLPEAQLDRFFFKLDVGYSSRTELHEILDRTTRAESPTIEKVLDAQRIIEIQKLVRQVMIAPNVQDYAIRCVLATHPEGEFASSLSKQFLRVGGSPRAAQSLVLGAKVRALLDGRGHVAIEDIKAILLPAMRHRILLNFEAQAEGMTTDMILQDIAEKISANASTSV